MGSVVYKSRNVILRHLRQLFLENTFQASQNDERLALVVVVDDTELYVALSFLDNGRLRGCVLAKQH